MNCWWTWYAGVILRTDAWTINFPLASHKDRIMAKNFIGQIYEEEFIRFSLEDIHAITWDPKITFQPFDTILENSTRKNEFRIKDVVSERWFEVLQLKDKQL